MAFSFGARRRQHLTELSDCIASLANYAPGAPLEMQWQFVDDLEGGNYFLLLFFLSTRRQCACTPNILCSAGQPCGGCRRCMHRPMLRAPPHCRRNTGTLLPALQSVHSGFVFPGLLEDSDAGDPITQTLGRLQNTIHAQQQHRRALAAAESLGAANDYFSAVLQAAEEACGSPAAAPRPVSGTGSGAAGASGSGASAAAEAGAAHLEQCRTELAALAAAHEASRDAVMATLNRCCWGLDDSAVAEVRNAGQEAQPAGAAEAGQAWHSWRRSRLSSRSSCWARACSLVWRPCRSAG